MGGTGKKLRVRQGERQEEDRVGQLQKSQRRRRETVS
jgi:hypothetical protein